MAKSLRVSTAIRTVLELLGQDEQDKEFSSGNDSTSYTCNVNGAYKWGVVKARLDELDVQIESLNEIHDKMIVRRDLLQNCLDILARPFDLDVLPDELLSKIFEHVCEDLSSRHVELRNICQANQRFRSVAIGTVTLWGYVDLRRQSLREVKLYLDRSGQSPLDIDHYIDADTFHSKTLPLMRIMLREAYRIRRVGFTYFLPNILPSFMAAVPEMDMPVLEEIRFSYQYVNGHMRDMLHLVLPWTTPRLRSFRGDTVTLSAPTLNTITELQLFWLFDCFYCPHLSSMDQDPFIAILTTVAQLPNLRSFHFRVDTRYAREPTFVRDHLTVSLPMLLELAVTVGGCVDLHAMAFLLSHLETPSLQSMDLRFRRSERRSPDDIRAIMDAFGKHGALENLRCLKLIHLDDLDPAISHADSFFEMLSRMASLERIFLITKHLVSDETLLTLRMRDGLCPVLRSVHLQECAHVTQSGIRYLLNGPRSDWPEVSIADCPQISTSHLDSISNEMGRKFLGGLRQDLSFYN